MRNLATALLLISGLAACAAPPQPEDHFYRLEVGVPTATVAQPQLDGTLTVQRLHMPGVYGERPLLYSTAQAPTELRQYHYHYWIDNPARLIEAQLTAYLRAADIARNVNAPTNGGMADYQISGTVHRLEQRLDRNGAHAIAELELIVTRKADNSALLNRIYRADITTTTASALAAAQGMSQALTVCFEQLVADLRRR